MLQPPLPTPHEQHHDPPKAVCEEHDGVPSLPLDLVNDHGVEGLGHGGMSSSFAPITRW